MAVHVYDQICGVGAAYGLTHVGLKALGSLRMEKGYRDYGHDLDNLDTLLEAGLGFTADLGKCGGFVGQEVWMPCAPNPPLPRASRGKTSKEISR